MSLLAVRSLATIGTSVMATKYDAAMANVSVAFAVTAGGGSVGAASVATNAQGQASTTWTLGATAGANASWPCATSGR